MSLRGGGSRIALFLSKPVFYAQANQQHILTYPGSRHLPVERLALLAVARAALLRVARAVWAIWVVRAAWTMPVRARCVARVWAVVLAHHRSVRVGGRLVHLGGVGGSTSKEVSFLPCLIYLRWPWPARFATANYLPDRQLSPASTALLHSRRGCSSCAGQSSKISLAHGFSTL